jgi:TetR/AcrR family transcriptional regulator, lmrAB and yxaGH operons repressor
MPRSTDAREKALLTAERLFRIQGYTATGLTQILEESGAPKGSFYFHFPGGKEQMAREVLHAYGARAEAAIRTLARRHDGEPGAFVLALCRALAHELEASGWAMGCAAQNLANELAPANRQIAAQLTGIFATWAGVVANAIRPACPSRAAATRTATALVAALEGARTLARVARSSAPFDAIAEQFQLSPKADR